MVMVMVIREAKKPFGERLNFLVHVAFQLLIMLHTEEWFQLPCVLDPFFTSPCTFATYGQ